MAKQAPDVDERGASEASTTDADATDETTDPEPAPTEAPTTGTGAPKSVRRAIAERRGGRGRGRMPDPERAAAAGAPEASDPSSEETNERQFRAEDRRQPVQAPAADAQRGRGDGTTAVGAGADADTDTAPPIAESAERVGDEGIAQELDEQGPQSELAAVQRRLQQQAAEGTPFEPSEIEVEREGEQLVARPTDAAVRETAKEQFLDENPRFDSEDLQVTRRDGQVVVRPTDDALEAVARERAIEQSGDLANRVASQLPVGADTAQMAGTAVERIGQRSLSFEAVGREEAVAQAEATADLLGAGIGVNPDAVDVERAAARTTRAQFGDRRRRLVSDLDRTGQRPAVSAADPVESESGDAGVAPPTTTDAPSLAGVQQALGYNAGQAVNTGLTNEVTRGGFLSETPSGNSGLLPGSAFGVDLSEQGLRRAARDIDRVKQSFRRNPPVTIAGSRVPERALQGVASGAVDVLNAPQWVVAGETAAEVGQNAPALVRNPGRTGATAFGLGAVTAASLISDVRTNPTRAGGRIATGIVTGSALSRAIDRTVNAYRGGKVLATADRDRVQYGEITDERGREGELSQFDTGTGEPTAKAVSEVERKARDNPEEIVPEDADAAAFHTTEGDIEGDLEVGEGSSELPGLFVSPNASPIGLTLNRARSYLRGLRNPRLPGRSRGDRVVSVPADDVRGMPSRAQGFGYEVRDPDTGAVLRRGLSRGKAKAIAERQGLDPESDVFPDQTTGGYRFLTDQADENAVFVRPTGSRTSELEGIVPAGSRYVEEGVTPVELPSGRIIPGRRFRDVDADADGDGTTARTAGDDVGDEAVDPEDVPETSVSPNATASATAAGGYAGAVAGLTGASTTGGDSRSAPVSESFDVTAFETSVDVSMVDSMAGSTATTGVSVGSSGSGGTASGSTTGSSGGGSGPGSVTGSATGSATGSTVGSATGSAGGSSTGTPLPTSYSYTPPSDSPPPSSRPRLDDEDDDGLIQFDDPQAEQSNRQTDDPFFAPGWLSQTVATAATLGGLTGVPSQATLAARPASEQFVGELPTGLQLSGTRREQRRFAAVAGLLGNTDPAVTGETDLDDSALVGLGGDQP